MPTSDFQTPHTVTVMRRRRRGNAKRGPTPAARRHQKARSLPRWQPLSDLLRYLQVRQRKRQRETGEGAGVC